MGKQQKSKRAREHKKQAISSGLYANTGHPSHLSNWQRTAQNHSYFSKMIDEGHIECNTTRGGDFMESRCPRCKEKVEDKDNFCPKCGECLTESKETQSESTLLEEDR